LRSKLESFGSTTLNELPEQKPLIKQIIKDSVPIAKQAIENNLRSQLVNYLGPLSFNELPRQIPLIFEAVFEGPHMPFESFFKAPAVGI
jgi:hypothetical protein